jgi:hypothetical protein
MLLDETSEPKALPLSLLEDITGGFSDDREIGRGAFSVVYKVSNTVRRQFIRFIIFIYSSLPVNGHA